MSSNKMKWLAPEECRCIALINPCTLLKVPSGQLLELQSWGSYNPATTQRLGTEILNCSNPALFVGSLGGVCGGREACPKHLPHLHAEEPYITTPREFLGWDKAVSIFIKDETHGLIMDRLCASPPNSSVEALTHIWRWGLQGGTLG